MPHQQMIGTTEAARRLGVSARRIRDYIQDGRLKAFQIGATWLIDASELDSLPKRTNGYPAGKSRKKV
jgi:excisionase family DNA binding protein